MSIHRGAGPGDKVVTILRAAAQDNRLSYRARGILLALMSRPTDWQTNYRLLAQDAREGEHAVLAALRELDVLGYLSRPIQRQPNGQLFTGWAITDAPGPIKRAGRAGRRLPQPGKPQPGKPQPGVPQPGVPQPGVPQPGVPQPGVPQPGKPQPRSPEPGSPQPRFLQPLLERETKEPPPPTSPTPPPAGRRRGSKEEELAARDLHGAVLAALPQHVRGVHASSARARCRELHGLGWTPQQLGAEARAHSWVGAGAGAVLAWLRDLEAPPAPVLAPAASRKPCPECGTPMKVAGRCEPCETAHVAVGYLRSLRSGGTQAPQGGDQGPGDATASPPQVQVATEAPADEGMNS